MAQHVNPCFSLGATCVLLAIEIFHAITLLIVNYRGSTARRSWCGLSVAGLCMCGCRSIPKRQRSGIGLFPDSTPQTLELFPTRFSDLVMSTQAMRRGSPTCPAVSSSVVVLAVLLLVFGLSRNTWAYDETNQTYYPLLTAPKRLYVAAIWGTGSPGFFRGAIDEVMIFNRALSGSEIQTIYAAGGNGVCKTIQFTSVSRSTDNSTQLTIKGPAADNYEIQASTDFSTWNLLKTIPNPQGVFPYLDAGTTNFPNRFYRVVIP